MFIFTVRSSIAAPPIMVPSGCQGFRRANASPEERAVQGGMHAEKLDDRERFRDSGNPGHCPGAATAGGEAGPVLSHARIGGKADARAGWAESRRVALRSRQRRWPRGDH